MKFTRKHSAFYLRSGSLARNLVLAWLLVALAAPSGLHADFSVFRAPSHIVSLFALPGEDVPFDLATYAGTVPKLLDRYQIESSDGIQVVLEDECRFVLTAPREIGIYPVSFQELTEPGVPRPLPYRVQIVVMRPATEAVDGILNGYPIGTYPTGDSNQPWQFDFPRGFVEITETNRSTLLSDHISLADIACKLDAPFPRYAAIRTPLLLKLEGLADQLLQRGLPGDAIKVLSGFRTPGYNAQVGNRTKYSRHIVGDAADIYIDYNGDEIMDDLNGDGRVNRRDAAFLLEIVDEMDHSEDYAALVGGAAAYRTTGSHGPFVHIDTRGFPTRW
jgi:hypothetical protein